VTDSTITPPPGTILRPAARLAAGDRIAARFLPDGDAADVLFVYGPDVDGSAVLVYRFDDGRADSCRFRAAGEIWLESLADASGLGFSREPESTVVFPVPADVEGHPEGGRAPAPGVVAVADGHVVHECCGKLDDAEHRDFCAAYVPPVHLESERALTACRLAIIDLPAGHGWTNDHAAVTCKACINELPF
jgi:hypothetical protein